MRRQTEILVDAFGRESTPRVEFDIPGFGHVSFTRRREYQDAPDEIIIGWDEDEGRKAISIPGRVFDALMHTELPRLR